jgi:hypothetical protein
MLALGVVVLRVADPEMLLRDQIPLKCRLALLFIVIMQPRQLSGRGTAEELGAGLEVDEMRLEVEDKRKGLEL